VLEREQIGGPSTREDPVRPKFKIDQRALDRVVKDATKSAARQAQPTFDALLRNCGGKPVDEVAPHVRAAFRRAGWKFDESDVASTPTRSLTAIGVSSKSVARRSARPHPGRRSDATVRW
jgi:hypothetical protein